MHTQNKWNKSFYKKNNEKGLSKSFQVEFFHYGVKAHFASNCLTPKKNKKVM